MAGKLADDEWIFALVTLVRRHPGGYLVFPRILLFPVRKESCRGHRFAEPSRRCRVDFARSSANILPLLLAERRTRLDADLLSASCLPRHELLMVDPVAPSQLLHRLPSAGRRLFAGLRNAPKTAT